MQAKFQNCTKAMHRSVWTLERILEHVDLVNGVPNPDLDQLTLFSIWRNEWFFSEAFFAHYRALGVKQFVILDDGSTDRISEFSLRQQECLTVRSELGFGDLVIARSLDSQIAKMRAGKFLMIAVPHVFLRGQFSVCVDADEFLLFQPDVADLGTMIMRLAQRGDKAALDSVVEFYPSKLQDLTNVTPVQSIDDLFGQAPFFDARVLLQILPDGSNTKIAPSASRRLFDREQVFANTSRVRNMRRHKTLLLWNDSKAFKTGSHNVSVHVATDISFFAAHFVFTGGGKKIWRVPEKTVATRKAHRNTMPMRPYMTPLRSLTASGYLALILRNIQGRNNCKQRE